MITKTNIAIDRAKGNATTMHSSRAKRPNAEIVTKILHNEINDPKNCHMDAMQEYRNSIRMSKIHTRLIVSLMFSFLPGMVQFPSLAQSFAPVAVVAEASITTGVPTVAQAPTAASPPPLLDRAEISSQRQSMDAARLLLEDYSGRRRVKIPESLKKEMDMQDRRLALCQELSRDSWDWEQCFYYGTNNGGGNALYFDKGIFEENSSGSKVAATSAKPKIPTW